MKNKINYYEILQLDSKADPKTIEAAYHQLAQQYISKAMDDDEAFNKLSELRKAKIILLDPEKRKKYDDELFSKETQNKKPSQLINSQNTNFDEVANKVLSENSNVVQNTNFPKATNETSIPETKKIWAIYAFIVFLGTIGLFVKFDASINVLGILLEIGIIIVMAVLAFQGYSYDPSTPKWKRWLATASLFFGITSPLGFYYSSKGLVRTEVGRNLTVIFSFVIGLFWLVVLISSVPASGNNSYSYSNNTSSTIVNTYKYPTVIDNQIQSPTLSMTQKTALACKDALSVNLNDVGKTLCIKGYVTSAYYEQRLGSFMILFDNTNTSLILWSKGLSWIVSKGECITGTGLISVDPVNNRPVMYFGKVNDLHFCQ